MQPYQDRVITELHEVRERLDKLLAFIHDTETDTFKNLPDQDRKLMILQGASMATYIFILEQRVDRFVE